MGCNWAGDTIVRDTVMWDKRAVLGFPGVYIPTDIREWFSCTDNEVIRRAIQEMGLPEARSAGTFDARAWKIWKYVAESVQYIEDKASFGLDDFWLFPEETLTLHKGDCEDSSFLLASLLLSSGISDHCVRVVLGKIVSAEVMSGHAWVVYQSENGVWCLLESTLDSIPERLIAADSFMQPGGQYQYQPQFCINPLHLWWIGPSGSAGPQGPLGEKGSKGAQMADYLRLRKMKACQRTPQQGMPPLI
jgi:hypothetical protein